jgi:hypothetical protein
LKQTRDDNNEKKQGFSDFILRALVASHSLAVLGFIFASCNLPINENGRHQEDGIQAIIVTA